MHVCLRVGLMVVAVGFAGMVFTGCGGATTSVTDAGTQQDAGSRDAGSSDAGSSDAGSSDAGSSDAGSSDAGLSDAGDEPFGCTGSSIPGSDPAYVVGAALRSFTGGPIATGLYRAVTGTREYTEVAPGNCVGVTPPIATPYRTELELRPSRYALRVLSTATSGSWTTSSNALKLTQSCPDVKPEGGVAYTATPTTIVFQATKQDYVSGGCHWYMVYTLERQP